MELLHKDLSYQIQGIAIEIRKNYGSGHKESIYQNIFEETLRLSKISYEREKSIGVYSVSTGKVLGFYRPDFIINSQIIIELKALSFVPHDQLSRMYDYLRNSEFELGYFINFASPQLYMKRVIFTNDRKPHITRQ